MNEMVQKLVDKDERLRLNEKHIEEEFDHKNL